MRSARRLGKKSRQRLSHAGKIAALMSSYHLDHLQHLETEAIHIMPAQMNTGRQKNSPHAPRPPMRAVNFSRTGM